MFKKTLLSSLLIAALSACGSGSSDDPVTDSLSIVSEDPMTSEEALQPEEGELPESNESTGELPESNESTGDLSESNESTGDLPELNESTGDLVESVNELQEQARDQVTDQAINLPETVEVPQQQDITAAVFCESANADPDGDGIGFENNRACTINAEFFTDVPVGSSIGNPYRISMGAPFTGTSTGKGSVYFSVAVTSTNPVSVSVNEEFYYSDVRQGEQSWGEGYGVVFDSDTRRTDGNPETTHYCLPIGTYQIEIQKIPWVDFSEQQSHTITVEQVLNVPCVAPPEETVRDSYPRDYTQRGIYTGTRGSISGTNYTVSGVDQNGDDEWSFLSDTRITEVLKGDDGLVYVYVQHENPQGTESENQGEQDLLILDPDNLAVDEQLALAQPPNSNECENGSAVSRGTICPGSSIDISSAENTQNNSFNVGDAQTGTLSANSLGLSYSITVNGHTPVSFVNTGSAVMSLKSLTGQSYLRLGGTAEFDTNTTKQSLCLPAGTYQLDLSNHRVDTASYYSFSVDRSDISCIQPIHVASPYPFFSPDRYHLFTAVPSSTGLIYYKEPSYGLSASDWQGNLLWHKNLGLGDIGVTDDGAIHVGVSPNSLETGIISYDRYGDELSAKFYSDSVSVFAKNDTVLTVPIFGSAIQAYDSNGNLLWLHSVPDGASDYYLADLIDSQTQP